MFGCWQYGLPRLSQLFYGFAQGPLCLITSILARFEHYCSPLQEGHEQIHEELYVLRSLEYNKHVKEILDKFYIRMK